jgi:hypothetical protein
MADFWVVPVMLRSLSDVTKIKMLIFALSHYTEENSSIRLSFLKVRSPVTIVRGK